MKSAGLLFTFILVVWGGKPFAQQNYIGDVLAALGGKINPHLSMADSLYPLPAKATRKLQREFSLSRRQATEIKKNNQNSKGIKTLFSLF